MNFTFGKPSVSLKSNINEGEGPTTDVDKKWEEVQPVSKM